MVKLKTPDYISSLKPYKPGKPLEELEREYGISDSIKLASNENPLGPSPEALKAIQGALGNLHRYPDGSGFQLKCKISEKFGVGSGQVVLGNGSDEIIQLIAQAFLMPGEEVIMGDPAFAYYQMVVAAADGREVMIPLKDFSYDLSAMADRITEKTKLIFIISAKLMAFLPKYKISSLRLIDIPILKN